MRTALATLVLLLGCGTNVRRGSDGGATATTDAAPGADVTVSGCPGRVAPGLACASGARPCLSEDRCNDCFCTADVWTCGSRVCVDAGVCPADRPRTGDACITAGQSCSYGAGCAGAECLCAGGRWTCDAFFCPDR